MSNQLNKLIGKVPDQVIGKKNDGEFIIIFECGSKLRLYHSKECCEQFWLEDIVGEIDDLIGNPLSICEEVSTKGSIPVDSYNSQTWTYYKFATIKGYVDLRFIGESNGYYSESCDIEIKLSGE